MKIKTIKVEWAGNESGWVAYEVGGPINHMALVDSIDVVKKWCLDHGATLIVE